MVVFVWEWWPNCVEIQAVENPISGSFRSLPVEFSDGDLAPLSTQLCVAVQTKYGVSSGETGTVIYIDTEGSFVPIRLQNMAMTAEMHYRNVERASLNPEHVEQILKNVIYFRCVNIAELFACLIQLDPLMKKEGNVKLIVLDSLAHPIRSMVDGDHLMRHKYTVRIVSTLLKIAHDHQCAVSIPGGTEKGWSKFIRVDGGGQSYGS